jgi:EAL domain-containing protein (putative c-di-GMP-specific phosphodiesterase class I)/GGDEF domain-containing protein
MNGNAVAPAILLIVDEPDTLQLGFVDELSKMLTIAIISSPAEEVLYSCQKRLAIFLSDILSSFGLGALESSPNPRHILVVGGKRYKNRGVLETIPLSHNRSLGFSQRSGSLVPREQEGKRFENGTKFALVEYTRNSLSPVYANLEFLSFFHLETIGQLTSRVPDIFMILKERTREYLKHHLDDADSLNAGFSLSFLAKHPQSGLCSEIQFSLTNLHPCKTGNALFLLEVKQKGSQCPEKRVSLLENPAGIPFREQFYEMTEAMISRQSAQTFLYIRVSILHFWQYTEYFGQERAESLLHRFTCFLGRQFSPVGTFAHLYADQFAVCVPEKGFDLSFFCSQAEKVLQTKKLGSDLSVALGIVKVQTDKPSLQRINKMAKMALSETLSGKRCKAYTFFSMSLRKNALVQQRLMTDIPLALETCQIEFYLQPVFSPSKNRFVSAEALARWNHPTLGFLLPEVFIPLFEKRGMIADLDLFILASVCRFQRSLLDSGIAPLPVSVNLSQSDFSCASLGEKVVSLVDGFSIPHSLVCFEVTEQSYQDNPGQLLEILQSLKSQGFPLLLDDYGAGYSSLSLLTKAPIDILKIDRDFTRQIQVSDKVETALQAVTKMASLLGIGVIAEGVENEMQSSFYQRIGCDLIQGYLYAKPLKSESYRLLLKAKEENLC